MGRTVTPFSQVVEAARQQFGPFRRALRKTDQQAFDELFEWARLHVQAGVQLASLDPREPVLLAVLIELRKEQLRLLARVSKLEQALAARRGRTHMTTRTVEPLRKRWMNCASDKLKPLPC